MYLIIFTRIKYHKNVLTINNISVKTHFRDRKDTKCWISTDVQIKENELPHPLLVSKHNELLVYAGYFV